MLPKQITIKNNALPDNPGVYLYYDKKDKLLYIGKATSLKKRVGSYFSKAHDNRIADLVARIARIDYIETPTVIEALVLEANQIKAHQPPYNIMQRDDKSFLYLVITNEDFPKPLLMRGQEIEEMGINPFSKFIPTPSNSPLKRGRDRFKAIYGPYPSGRSLRIALDLMRKSIPWSVCEPGAKRACFYRHLGQCPGVCTGEISKKDYAKIIKNLMLFFADKKDRILKQMKKEMATAAKKLEFEKAAELKKKIFALTHIQDVALITRDEPLIPLKIKLRIDPLGRVEAYDISNISGTSAVGSMVVFEGGKPNKAEYRKFKIKTVVGVNDVACMEEVIRRRLKHTSWPLPELMVIDGGKPQVNRVQSVLDEMQIKVPIVGLAKGFDRKQDVLVFPPARGGTDGGGSRLEVKRVAEVYKELLQRARDEAHRFAIKYHRIVRNQGIKIKRTKGK